MDGEFGREQWVARRADLRQRLNSVMATSGRQNEELITNELRQDGNAKIVQKTSGFITGITAIQVPIGIFTTTTGKPIQLCID